MTGPWLTIVGLGEDGADGLGRTAREALSEARCVIGPPRHLALIPDTGARRVPWPVPFADGLTLLEAERGHPTVALASGDPFWFGAGRLIAARLDPGEWRALPGPSVFSLAAARLGWALEGVTCLALHAAPLARLRPHLAPGARLIVTLRDGAAVPALGAWLAGAAAGASRLTVLEALGGPRERIRATTADTATEPAGTPVACAIEVAIAPDLALPLVPGRPEDVFEHDGQITKAPIRALTLAALAPRPGQRLWDIGGGSGAVALEWLMAHPSLSAACLETRPDRAQRIVRNAAALGQDRLEVIEGRAPEALDRLGAPPDAVFVGGGLSPALLNALAARAPGARLVVNAVTLESEALVLARQAVGGGTLMRVETQTPAPTGAFRTWAAARPILQWSTVL